MTGAYSVKIFLPEQVISPGLLAEQHTLYMLNRIKSQVKSRAVEYETIEQVDTLQSQFLSYVKMLMLEKFPALPVFTISRKLKS